MKVREGQKLRCVHSPNKYIVRGHFYEVAEILEMPGHAMVRKPDSKWPKPGEPYFGWHPEEYFEGSTRGIPALSCGYEHEELEFFGAVVPNSLFPTPPVWSGRDSKQRERISDIVDSSGIPQLWWLAYHNVLRKVCLPASLENDFLLLGIDFQDIKRRTTYKAVSDAVRMIMIKLGIATKSIPSIEDQYVEFWRRSWRKAGLLTWKTWERK